MTLDEIKVALANLTLALLDKGMQNPSVVFTVKANESKFAFHGSFRKWESKNKYNPDANSYGHVIGQDEVASVALVKIWEQVEALPSKADIDKARFLNLVDEAVDFGRKNGIDADYINPLIEQMKKLSGNIIEHKPRSTEDDDFPF